MGAAGVKWRRERWELGAKGWPWGKGHWERTGELFGGDPWPYGLKTQNRLVVGSIVQERHEQGFIENVPEIDSLFIVPQDAANY